MSLFLYDRDLIGKGYEFLLDVPSRFSVCLFMLSKCSNLPLEKQRGVNLKAPVTSTVSLECVHSGMGLSLISVRKLLTCRISQFRIIIKIDDYKYLESTHLHFCDLIAISGGGRKTTTKVSKGSYYCCRQRE